MTNKRTFTKEEKLQVLKEAEEILFYYPQKT